MAKIRKSASELTDEQVLKEFVSRFQCDGAILVYFDGEGEFGFSRWINKNGKVWCKDMFRRVRENVFIDMPKTPEEGGETVTITPSTKTYN